MVIDVLTPKAAGVKGTVDKNGHQQQTRRWWIGRSGRKQMGVLVLSWCVVECLGDAYIGYVPCNSDTDMCQMLYCPIFQLECSFFILDIGTRAQM